jgi:DNA-binding transcriptional LysR family regulator
VLGSARVTSRSHPKLASIDLNLLVALDALLREGNVTSAGRRIGLSQPATSQALARLRQLLGDPLLVRDGRAMRTTTFAERMAPRVRLLIGEIEATLLGHQRFVPEQATRTFRIATNDYCGATFMPEVLERTRAAAPLVDIEFHAYRGHPSPAELARRELDLGVGVFLHMQPGIESCVLFQDRFVCLVRKGHPRVPRALTLARFIELDHLLVSAPDYGLGVVDHALAAKGLHRRVAARVPYFLVAPALVARTDLVLTLPARLAQQAAAAHELRILPTPIELAPFAVRMIWHAGTNDDLASQWLRARIQEVARALAPS